jgi:GTPase SAR1 family protein
MGCCCTAQAVRGTPATRISVLGLPGVGKTSFIEFLCGEYNRHDPPIPTGGLTQRQVMFHGRPYLLYDVCGYARFAPAWVEVVQKSAGVILMFDKRIIETAFIHVVAMYEAIAPEIVHRRLPTLVLMNAPELPEDMAPFQALNATKLAGTTAKMWIISRFDQDALDAFAWLEQQISS